MGTGPLPGSGAVGGGLVAGSVAGPDVLGDAGGLADVLAEPSGVAGAEEMAGLDGAELDAAGDDLVPAAAPTCAAGVILAPNERWNRALHMRVERPMVVANG